MSKRIASLKETSDIFDTFAKFVRVMEMVGVMSHDLMLPINNKAARRNLAVYLEMGCPKVALQRGSAYHRDRLKDRDGLGRSWNTPEDYANVILGHDFITPERVELALGLTYTGWEKKELRDTIPVRDELEWLDEREFMLVPCPPKSNPLCLNSLCQLRPTLFSEDWEEMHSDPFPLNQDGPIGGGWLKLRKEIVPNSHCHGLKDAPSLLSEEEYVPNVTEAVWGTMVYYIVRGIKLFWVGGVTTTPASMDFGHERFMILPGDHPGSTHGIISARK